MSSNIPFAGYIKGGTFILCINLTDFGQGWKFLEIPQYQRNKHLKHLEKKINQYRNNSDYRRNIGPNENVDVWLQDHLNYPYD